MFAPQPITFIAEENDPPFYMPFTRRQKRLSACVYGSIAVLLIGLILHDAYEAHRTGGLGVFITGFGSLFVFFLISKLRDRKYELNLPNDKAVKNDWITINPTSENIGLIFAKRKSEISWDEISVQPLQDFLIFTSSAGIKAYLPRRAFKTPEEWQNVVAFFLHKGQHSSS